MKRLHAILAGLAASVAAPAAAQSLVVVNFEIGTPADRAAVLNLDNLTRDGDFVMGIANVQYAEPFVDEQGGRRYGQWLRVQVNCKTNEVRQLLFNGYADMGDTRSGAAFAAVRPAVGPAVVKPDSIFVTSMCGTGAMKAPWQLLNSEFTEAPEKRKVMDEDAQKHPWTTLGGADQSFVRVRTVVLAQRANADIRYWPASKPIVGLPAATGFMATPFSWQFDGQFTGKLLIQGGYVELPTAMQLADNLWFYSLVGVASATNVKPAATLRYDLGVEVRCKPTPVQRIAGGEWFTLGDKVSTLPVPAREADWNANLFAFSRAICAKKFDRNAKRLPDAAAVLTELRAAYPPPK